MKKKTIVSKNELWTDTITTWSALADSDDQEEIERQRQETSDPEGYVKQIFDRIVAEATGAFAKSGLPIKPGMYAYFGDDPRPWRRDDLGYGIALREAQKAGKSIHACTWPNLAHIEELSPVDFARRTLNLIRQILEKAEAGADAWSVLFICIPLLRVHHQMRTESDGIAEIAVAVNRKVLRNTGQENNVEGKRLRLPIVKAAAEELLKRPGTSRKRNARWMSGEIIKKVNADLLKAKIRTVGKETIAADLRAMGYRTSK